MSIFNWNFLFNRERKNIEVWTKGTKSLEDMYKDMSKESDERLRLGREFTENNKPIFNEGNLFGKWMVVESFVTKNAGKWCYEYYLLNTETLKNKLLLEKELVLLSNTL